MVRILGGGPAGAAAAIAAARAGAAAVEVYEQSRVPRHKVCGEFLSPEALRVLERLGVLEECARAGPAPISRFVLHVGRWEKRGRLPEAGWGLSRYQLDRILLERAAALGARILRERRCEAGADVAAGGRQGIAAPRRGARLFGFKSHFRGPADDAVELYFFPSGYVGVNPIEGGRVNVCGLVREHALAAHGFEPDALLATRPGLAERARALSRTMEWLITGPVVCTQELHAGGAAPYPAGDRLCFVEPFTGTGILSALVTGSLAGAAASRGVPPAKYFRDVRRVLGRPVLWSGVLSAALDTGWAAVLAPLAPSGLLFRLTRPRVG